MMEQHNEGVRVRGAKKATKVSSGKGLRSRSEVQ